MESQRETMNGEEKEEKKEKIRKKGKIYSSIGSKKRGVEMETDEDGVFLSLSVRDSLRVKEREKGRKKGRERKENE